MSYQKTKQKLITELSQLRGSLESYCISADPSPLYIARQRKLIHSIESFISVADHEISELHKIQDRSLELQRLRAQAQDDKKKIQKLALLVAVSGMKHPHIQTPTWLLHQMYLYKRGDTEAFTVITPISTIELPGI